MPFPSGRCQTCRARHLKCDENRPTCAPCRKSKRTCTWEDHNPTDLVFRDENFYASSLARRRRGGARTHTVSKWPHSLSKGQYCAERVTLQSNREAPGSRALYCTTAANPLNTYQLSESIVGHARTKLFFSYIDIDLHANPGIWSFFYKYRHDMYPMATEQCATTAYDAFALAEYGRSLKNPAAILAGRAKYAAALEQFRHFIELKANAISDQALLCSLLLASCEDGLALTLSGRSVAGYVHMPGMASLLKLRQENGHCTQQGRELDRAASNRIIRQAMYRGHQIPPTVTQILLTNAEEPELSLDTCIAEVADMRHHAVEILRVKYASLSSPEQIDALLAIYRYATEADRTLQKWGNHATKIWAYQRYRLPQSLFAELRDTKLFFSPTVDDYSHSGIHVAIDLNRYRAARLICLGYEIRMLQVLLQHHGIAHIDGLAPDAAADLPTHSDTLYLIQENCRKADILVTGILQSIPGFFCHPLSIKLAESASDFQRAPIGLVGQLTWPLMVVSASPSCGNAERRYVKRMIMDIACRIGNKFLVKAAVLDLHNGKIEGTSTSTQNVDLNPDKIDKLLLGLTDFRAHYTQHNTHCSSDCGHVKAREAALGSPNDMDRRKD